MQLSTLKCSEKFPTAKKKKKNLVQNINIEEASCRVQQHENGNLVYAVPCVYNLAHRRSTIHFC